MREKCYEEEMREERGAGGDGDGWSGREGGG
jgi:hypothetical protein